MGEGSPLFHSALELLAHAIEHYAAGQDRDRKFMVLHLANAAELLLKDCMLDAERSIYKNPKETKSVYAVVEELEEAGVCIPHKHFLEILIDERNNIQHRFGSQSEIMAKWYMENMMRFFGAFMSDRLGLDLQEYLVGVVPKEVLQYVYADVAEKEPLITARQIAKVHPSGAVLSAWIEVERKVEQLRATAIKAHLIRESERPAAMLSPTLIVRSALEVLPDERQRRDLWQQFRDLQRRRAFILHGDEAPSEKEARKLIDGIAGLLGSLDELLAAIPKPEPLEADELPFE